MTTSNSGYVCGTMEKLSIRQFSRVKVGKGTMACQACGNARRGSEVSWRSGVNSTQGRKWSSRCRLPERTTGADGDLGFHVSSP
jgi:hypothetical protein